MTGSFVPHGHCYLWNPYLVGLHVTSDALTTLAYYTIPLILLALVQKRRDVPFDWIFLLFGAFIVLCGTTHLLEIWTLWHPSYWLSGWTKALTAFVSIATALLLIRLFPKLLAFPSPAQLAAVNHRLELEIKEHAQTALALQKEKEFVSALLDHLEDGIVACNEAGVLTLFNRATRTFHGLPEQPIPAEDWAKHFSLYQPDGQTQMQISDIPLFRALQGEVVSRVEMVIAPKQGRVRRLLASGQAIVDAQGKKLGAVVAMHDITEQKQAEEALRKANAELELRVAERTQELAAMYEQSRVTAITAQSQAQQLEQALHELRQTQAQLVQTEKMSSLGQLVAGIAHEINNPVNFIYGNITHATEYTEDLLHLINLYQHHYPEPVQDIAIEIQNLELDFLAEDFTKLLASMKIGADRIRQIVQSLRNFSRLDEAEIKAVDLHEGIDSTLLILQNRLKGKPDHPAIQVIKEYGNLPPIECYAGQLNQVFMNLLTNAIDALDEMNQKRTQTEIEKDPSIIRIQTQMVHDDVEIRIRDNGPGMTEATQQHLFEPFFTTKPVGAGTGLGLSISYQIVVERHGGQLHCISAPMKGSEFIVKLPQTIS